VVPVVTQENRRAAAEARILQEAFDTAGQAVFEVMADLFPSRPCRMSARDYATGLLAPLVRKNCVTIAEWAGHSVEVLERIYSKVLEGYDDRWQQQMDRFF
jgi:SRSO17 transposase